MQTGLLTRSLGFRVRRARGHRSMGLTLTEILIAVTITLVLMAVLVNATSADRFQRVEPSFNWPANCGVGPSRFVRTCGA